MNKVPQSLLDGREAIGPWNYSVRIPEGASSSAYALFPLLAALLFGCIGAFLGSDVGHNVAFWSNAAVWCSLVLSAMGALLSIWMFFGQWVWTAPQMALLGISVFAPFFWSFQGAPLAAFMLYSNTSFLAKSSILLVFVIWHGWWSHQTAKRCLSIWNDTTSREKIWIPYDCATVYRRSAAKSAMDAAGMTWHPGLFGLVLPIILCIPLYFYRHEIVEYLDAPWMPLIGFLLCFSPFALATTALTFSVVAMLVIPARIVSSTGAPVLVDMMTPSNAPR